MITAVSVNEKSLGAVIPERLESALGLLIVETDNNKILGYHERDWVEAMTAWDCEVLLCGLMYDREMFEEIALRGITRYQAAGLTAGQAIRGMLDYKLDNITDYVGGTGCAGHDGASECDLDCAGCSGIKCSDSQSP